MIHTSNRSLAILLPLITVFSYCNTSAHEITQTRTPKAPTIKQRLETMEDMITDLADTVTLESNRIDARLNSIEDKLDLILALLSEQEFEAYEAF